MQTLEQETKMQILEEAAAVISQRKAYAAVVQALQAVQAAQPDASAAERTRIGGDVARYERLAEDAAAHLEIIAAYAEDCEIEISADLAKLEAACE